MPYTVNKTNPAASPNQYIVQDSILNTQTDLSFVGKGYAGYGEVIAENFLNLLENFSNTTAPTKPIKGQLWYDESSNRLKVYTGTSFQPSSGVSYTSVTPIGLIPGDLWIDSNTQQLYFNNGVNNVLVGPPATSEDGAQNGFIFETIADATDVNQNITSWYNDGSRIAIISEDSFTPKIGIIGFANITKGITLSTAIAGLKFAGTATDADKLGGISATDFLKADIDETTTGTFSVVNDSGITVGIDSDLKLQVDGSGAVIQSFVTDGDITFKVNDGGIPGVSVMTIDGSTSRVGIGTINPTTKLDVVGTVNATALTATEITGALHSSAITILTNGYIAFEGSTNDDYETVLSVDNPTADRTITLPNRSGTVITTGDTGTVTSSMLASTVTLQILNSSGTVLKTIYGAGV